MTKEEFEKLLEQNKKKNGNSMEKIGGYHKEIKKRIRDIISSNTKID